MTCPSEPEGAEARVVRLVAERLAQGRREYGPLDPEGDRRDWLAEATEELLDAVVYLAAEMIRLQAHRDVR